MRKAIHLALVALIAALGVAAGDTGKDAGEALDVEAITGAEHAISPKREIMEKLPSGGSDEPADSDLIQVSPGRLVATVVRCGCLRGNTCACRGTLIEFKDQGERYVVTRRVPFSLPREAAQSPVVKTGLFSTAGRGASQLLFRLRVNGTEKYASVPPDVHFVPREYVGVINADDLTVAWMHERSLSEAGACHECDCEDRLLRRDANGDGWFELVVERACQHRHCCDKGCPEGFREEFVWRPKSKRFARISRRHVASPDEHGNSCDAPDGDGQ